MIIYEFIDRNGNQISYITYGHVNVDEFRTACVAEYGEMPGVVNHKYKIDKKDIRRDINGKIISCVDTSKYSSKWVKGAVEVTVGII
jgi:hypothetical protein